MGTKRRITTSEQKRVSLIASLITEDPNIIIENKRYVNFDSEYTFEDVPLGENVLANITYHFNVDASGSYTKATFYDPPESPDANISNVEPSLDGAYYDNGEEFVELSLEELSEMIPNWNEIALDYFDDNKNKVYNSIDLG